MVIVELQKHLKMPEVSSVMREARHVANLYGCDAGLDGKDVMFVQPADAKNPRLAGFRLSPTANGIRLIGTAKGVKPAVVKMLLAHLQATFKNGLHPDTANLLEGLQNG